MPISVRGKELMVKPWLTNANIVSMQYPRKPDYHPPASSNYIDTGNRGNEIQDLLKSFSEQITEAIKYMQEMIR